MEQLNKILIDHGISESIVNYVSITLSLIALLILCTLIELILKKIVFKWIARSIKHNKYEWDDLLLKNRVIERLIRVLPGVIFYIAAPFLKSITEFIIRLSVAYIIITSMFVFHSILDTINDIYITKEISKVRPIKGLLQVIKIITFIILFIILIATLIGKNPFIILSSIGALAAVFSFVFKDSILGFIAGIQLTSNDMLRIGDWVEMVRFGADGVVIDITLNTVKVQNFDKSIVTIPAYALISDSFRNWRGMLDFGGRRLKRSIYIDVNSIEFCNDDMIERFRKIDLLKDYIEEKEEELKEYNQIHGVNSELLINGRHMTNLGTFRAYVTNYLKHDSRINHNMVQLVRQLPPGDTGLPIEIYAFTNTTVWAEFEEIQSDIFDHIFAVVEIFGLRIFQSPTGHDIKNATLSEK